jgi:hypothetical protein
LDVDAFVALQKKNVETLVAAQSIWSDLVRTLVERQGQLVKDAFANAQDYLQGGFDAKRQPQAYIEGAKVLFEKVFAEVKETAELGLKAQRAVAVLFGERTTANVAEGKAAA